MIFFLHVVQTIKKIVHLTLFSSIFVFYIFRDKFWLFLIEKRDVSHYYAKKHKDYFKAIIKQDYVLSQVT